MVFVHVISSIHDRFDSLDPHTRKKLVKVSACVLGVVSIGKVCTFAYSYFLQRRNRQCKLHQAKTTKGKLLQKLVGLKKPIECRDTLTALSYNELRGQLEDSHLQVVDLLEAYQAKALEVDRNLNCITDIVYDADVTALYLDSLSREQRGRLHGIPLSVVENIKQLGFDSYYGCVSRCFDPEEETACVVEALLKEGMIPFARTTMSQAGMGISCSSPLFGETLNPHDSKRTSGGTSGGEGALIAGRGSIAGLGTDCGGSVRVPASCCGIYALKPTSDRMGCKSIAKCNNRYSTIFYQGQVGPMSSDIDLLVDMTRVLFSQTLFDLDDSIPKLPFNADVYDSKQPMRIGFFKSFTDTRMSIEVAPSVKRAIELAKAALERRGHTVVEWEPPRVGYACDLMVRCSLPDGECLKRLQKEEFFLSSSLRKLAFFAKMKPALKRMLAALCWLRDSVASRIILKSIVSSDALSLISDGIAYKEECAEAWSKANLDGLICPVLPFAAPLIEDNHFLNIGALYCNLFSFLNYPAGVVPVSRVNEDDIVQLKETYPRKQAHQRLILKSQSDSDGLPVGVQCVSKKWQDEKALRLMREVKLGLQLVAS